MKRFLMIAFAGAALTFLIPSAQASAADVHHGGGHVYNGGHGYVGHGGGHSNYGHGYTGGHGYYGGHGITGHGITGRYNATPYYGSAYVCILMSDACTSASVDITKLKIVD